MADLLDAVVGQMRERADVLRPAVAEYRELDEALQRLGANKIGTSRAPIAPKPREKRGPKRGRRQGNRRDQVLRTIEARPGLTATQLVKRIGMHDTYIFRLLPSLRAEGKVVRREADKTWWPVGGDEA